MRCRALPCGAILCGAVPCCAVPRALLHSPSRIHKPGRIRNTVPGTGTTAPGLYALQHFPSESCCSNNEGDARNTKAQINLTELSTRVGTYFVICLTVICLVSLVTCNNDGYTEPENWGRRRATGESNEKRQSSVAHLVPATQQPQRNSIAEKQKTTSKALEVLSPMERERSRIAIILRNIIPVQGLRSSGG